MEIRDDLREALQLIQKGQFEKWLNGFLLSDNKNKGLFEGLKKQKRYWIEPFEMELHMLRRTCGPEKEMEYLEYKEIWDKITKKMKIDLNKGWKPAPLIVTFKSGIFTIADGNHRAEVLRSSGVMQYWTCIWTDNKKDYKRAMEILKK